MAESRLNIELFKKIRDRIAAIPESYDQDYWCEASKAAPCGTTACLAGEAIICAAPTVEQGVEDLRRVNAADRRCGVPNRAAELLGLSGRWAAWVDDDNRVAAGETIIFDADAEGWPDEFRDEFRCADARERAEIAVEYLDHIIKTGKVLE